MGTRAISWVVDRTIATKLMTCFGLIIAVGLCGGWLTYRSLLNIEASDRSAIHSHEVLSTTRTVWIGILKQESDVRAYLLTGDRSFLDRAQASDKALKATLARIETLTGANSAQQARFGQLAGAIQVWQHEVFAGLAADAKTVSISAAFGADGPLNNHSSSCCSPRSSATRCIACSPGRSSGLRRRRGGLPRATRPSPYPTHDGRRRSAR